MHGRPTFHSKFNVYQCRIIMIFHFKKEKKVERRPFKVVQLLRLHRIVHHEYGLTHISSAFVYVFLCGSFDGTDLRVFHFFVWSKSTYYVVLNKYRRCFPLFTFYYLSVWVCSPICLKLRFHFYFSRKNHVSRLQFCCKFTFGYSFFFVLKINTWIAFWIFDYFDCQYFFASTFCCLCRRHRWGISCEPNFGGDK